MSVAVLLWRCGAAAGLAAAAALQPPSLAALQEAAAWLVRPMTLPFAWQAYDEASQTGSPDEAFAAAQRLLRLLPTWTAGHIAFAYRHALADDPRRGEPAIAAALTRLDAAMAWLEGARRSAGRFEHELLQALAFLPEVAVRQQPALATRLLVRGGTAGIADAYLAELERRFPSPARREQRTFFAPKLAAALLANHEVDAAVDVLQTAVARSGSVREADLAAEWAARLQEAIAALQGQAVDLSAVRADPRLAPLVPFLR